MFKKVVPTLIVLIQVACASNPDAPAGDPVPANPQVVINLTPVRRERGNRTFGTFPLVIAPGTAVVWVNDDLVDHEIVNSDGSQVSGRLRAGGMYTRVFLEPGDYPYYCDFHGYDQESGSIRVLAPAQAASASNSSASSTGAGASRTAGRDSNR